MATVKVILSDSSYNYTTSFNGSHEDAMSYFVGAIVNVGCVKDHLLECVSIVYIDD